METIGGPTDIPTDRQTERWTAAKQYALSTMKGGIKINVRKNIVITFGNHFSDTSPPQKASASYFICTGVVVFMYILKKTFTLAYSPVPLVHVHLF